MFGISGAALIIIAVAIVVPSGGWWYSSNELRVCSAEYEGFQATTKAKGELAESARVETETNLANAAVKIQERYNEAQTKLDAAYADYERLRRANKGNPGGRQTDNLADVTDRVECTAESEARLNTAMGNLEDGVLARLGKPRDEAINYANACKEQLDAIYEIINRRQNDIFSK